MGKKRGGRKRGGVEIYESDDERAYKTEKTPDRHTREFFYDEIDEFHANKDKISLNDKDNVSLLPKTWQDSDEEVLGLDDTEEDDDELIAECKLQRQRLSEQQLKDDMASDLDDDDDDADDVEPDEAHLPRWGKTRSSFYGADKPKKRFDEFSDSEANDYVLEEQEARALQHRQAAVLSENDFDFDFEQLEKSGTSLHTEKQKIIQDLSKLSKNEKWQLLKKESPELLPLIDKFKTMLHDIQHNCLPLLCCLQRQLLHPDDPQLVDFLTEKVHLLFDYCINVSFYLTLKAAREPNLHSHPIIKRLLEYQALIKQLQEVEQRFSRQLDKLTAKMKRKYLTGLIEDKSAVDSISLVRQPVELPAMKHAAKKRRLVEDDMTTAADVEMSSDVEDADVDDEAADSRRAITKQILQNRGLTPRRKKEHKNPRVKHRMKYRKAKIRRRGQVREVRKEMNPYGGELSGIRAGVKRGVRLKA